MLLLVSLSARAENVSLYLDAAPLPDLVKIVYGEVAKRPFIMSPAVLEHREPFTISVRQVSPSRLVEHVGSMLAAAGFRAVSHGDVFFIDKAAAAADDVVVYRPRYRSARYLADVVRPILGAELVEKRPKLQPGQMAERSPAEVRAAPGQDDPYQADQVAFQVKPKDAKKLEKLLADLDTPTGEVLLKAAVYEVGTTRQDGSAFQLALSLAGVQVGIGGVVQGDFIKLSSGGLEAVISALQRDSRFRSVSQPRLRVKNGSEARFTVGQDVPILGAQQLDRNGNPLQSVEYKASGIILTARPEIRDQVIELDLHQELSNFVATSTGVNNSPTLIKRSVKTQLQLTPGEVVILAGLQDEKEDGKSNRLPFFGWLLGDESTRQQTEVLVFIEATRI